MDTQIAVIKESIFEVRGVRVMLDVHLAKLYQVPTRTLKQAVRRNKDRFPEDFMFELDPEEYDLLKPLVANMQIEVVEEAKTGKHTKYLPFAFTELGVGMLSSVLRSSKAIEINISIMRAFVTLRQFAMGLNEIWERIDHIEQEMGIKFRDVFEALHLLTGGNAGRTVVTGFHPMMPEKTE